MVNILFCGNGKVFDGMLTSALSILKRTDSREPFCFYVFTMDVSHLKDTYVPIGDGEIDFLERVVRAYNPDSRVKKIDVTALYRAEFDRCPNESAYCSPYTLLRLLTDLVPDMPDKLLYLDVDLMFNRDVHLLYDTDIEGYEYAAARDHYGKVWIHPNYINAGVLLFNLAEMRKTGLLTRARELIRARKLVFADQSAIIRSTTRRKMLSQRFNDQKYLYRGTVVRHFSKRLFWLPYPHTDNIKQWQIDRMRRVFRYDEFDDVLREYVALKKIFEGENESNGEGNRIDILRV